MKKRMLAAGSVLLALIACVAASPKTAPTFTSIYPLAVAQGLDQTVTISGSGFQRNTQVLVNGVSYALNIQDSNTATFTFTPAMTQSVGFYSVQIKTANYLSQVLYFQVCAPVVIVTDSIPMTTGQPIGPEGQVKLSGGCIWQ